MDFKEHLALKESFRRADQHKLLRESVEAQTGIYYFFPMPKNNTFYWDFAKYFDSQYNDLQHESIWEKELGPFLMHAWKITDPEFLNYYTGLPRGRVIKSTKLYFVYHGNDTPVKQDIRQLVAREFGLPLDFTKEHFDDHEVMQGYDKNFVLGEIGINYYSK